MSSFVLSFNEMFTKPINVFGEGRDGVVFVFGVRFVVTITSLSLVLVFVRLFDSLLPVDPTVARVCTCGRALDRVCRG